MTILDYHHKVLCQDLWSTDELTLRPLVRDGFHSQMQSRFPNARGLLLVGDMVGHYYSDDSDIDLLVAAKADDVKSYLEESNFVSGHLLSGTNHRVNFHVLASDIAPATLATKFGPIYDTVAGVWYGGRVLDSSEMTRPEAVLAHISWRLYKSKNSTELEPGRWNILTEAFVMIPEEGRTKVVSKLKMTIAHLNKNIRNVIKQFNKADVWSGASRLAQVLDEGGDTYDIDQQVQQLALPDPVVAAIVNKYRYEDVVEHLEDLNEKLAKQQSVEEEERYQAYRTSAVEEPQQLGVKDSPLIDRMNDIINSTVASGGGHGSAVDTIVDIFAEIMQRNSYIDTDTRRKMILKKLKDRFYPRSLVCRVEEINEQEDQ